MFKNLFKGKVVAITGNIAAGKDLVISFLKEYFDIYIDVDKIGHFILKKKKIEIENIFKTSDRKILSDIVFSSKEKLNQLNRIVHPLLRRKILKIIEMHYINKKFSKFSILINCALLFKLKLEFFSDIIFGVYADNYIRLARLINFRGIEKNKAKKILDLQVNILNHKNKIHYLIPNNKDKTELKKRLFEIIKNIMEKEDAKRERT